VPGFLDYLMHRKSSIETTGGTHESLIHALQMTSIGIPTLMALLFEVNAAVIATAIGAAAPCAGPSPTSSTFTASSKCFRSWR
jgi:uncharacterized membrane protein